MKYVYGCSQDKAHPRMELVHGMMDLVRVACGACGAEMKRIPQPFTWGRRPFEVLHEHLENKYRKDRYRRSVSR
jgi:hypothetical protein